MRRRRLLGICIALLSVCQLVALSVLSRPAAVASAPLVRAGEEGVAVAPATATADPAPGITPPHPLVGAHYHVWYPSNFDQGFLRERLEPPQQPALGRYRSDDPSVAERQIEWASSAGVDFFTLDWWPTEPARNANALTGLLGADNIGDIDFAMFYETWNLGFDADNESTPMNADSIARFVEDMGELADTFFDHPSYLRIDGRPVVILYLSRTMTGDVAGAIAQARAALQARGEDVFLIGDEVFWRPLQPDRMRLFDAITAYNLYESEKPEHAGYASETSFVADQVELYRRHTEAIGGAVPLVPGVIPGYNDRGVRPSLGHYAIPRRWAPGAAEGTLLRELIDRVARPLIDPRLPMLFVTSWNEWNEDTAIEPLSPAAETGAAGPDSGLFTDGYTYGGGDAQVLALRDEVVAVSGRVMSEGRPVAGTRVEARAVGGGAVLAADTTDSSGRYRLSRWLLAPGDVVLDAAGTRAEVAVVPERTALVDIVLTSG